MRRSWLLFSALIACTAEPAPRSTLPARATPPSVPPRPSSAIESDEPADAARIWKLAIAGDLVRARASLEWFRKHPPDKLYAGPTYRPDVVCSSDQARCAFSLTFPAGTGVTDASGRPLGVLPGAMDRPFAFIGATHLLYLSGTPESVVDVDTFTVALQLPQAGWSTVDIGEKFVIFALDGVRASPEGTESDDEAYLQQIGVWDFTTRRMLFESRSELGAHPRVSVSNDESLVLAYSDSAAFAWRVEGRALVVATEHPGVGSPISAHGDRVAITSFGKAGAEVRLLDGSGKIIARSRACGDPRAVQLSPSGALLAVGGERHVCVLKVPSLAPVLKSTGLAKPADEWGQLAYASFHQSERVVAFSTNAGDSTLFELAGARRRYTTEGDLRESAGGELFVVDRAKKALISLRNLQEQSRRPLSDAELADSDDIPELSAPDPSRASSAAAERLQAALCMVHGHAFPPALCAQSTH